MADENKKVAEKQRLPKKQKTEKTERVPTLKVDPKSKPKKKERSGEVPVLRVLKD